MNNINAVSDHENIQIPGGEDTVHCSFYCRFTPRFLENLQTVAEAKRIAETPAESEQSSDPVFECGERLYVVMPYGFSPNKALSRYCYYKYILKDGGITIGLQPRECSEQDDEKKSNRPNVRVEIGALPLIVAGSMDKLMPDIEKRLQEMGLVIIKNRLSRVDACVDLPFPVRRLQHAVIARRFITRARSFALHVEFDGAAEDRAQVLAAEFDDENNIARLDFSGYACTGFTIGRDKILCRGYDKLEKEKHNEEMLLALEQRRCGGELWKHMTRIEFQVRRDALRGITVIGRKDGIETWQDWCRHKSSIVHYLCTEWLVFTEDEFDRSHSDRVKKNNSLWHSDWQKVVSACSRAFGVGGRKVARINSSIKLEAKDLLAQSVGCDQSAMIKTDIKLSPSDPLWKHKVAAFSYAATFNYLSDPEKEKAFWKNWHEKELRQECSVPEEALSDLVPLPTADFLDRHLQYNSNKSDKTINNKSNGNLSNSSSLASKGAGVTHSSPLLKDIGALLMTPGASGPAPSVIS